MDNITDFKDVYGFLSKQIFEVLSNRPFEEEIFYTYSIYLQVCVIKAHTSTIDAACMFCGKKIQLFGDERQVLIDKKSYNEMFKINKEILLEIINTVWKYEYDLHLSWIPRWMEFCEAKFKGLYSKDQVAFRIIDIINDHLEIRDQISNFYKLAMIADAFNEYKAIVAK
jgi:hypothetical protein